MSTPRCARRLTACFPHLGALMRNEAALCQPNAKLAAEIAARVLGRIPCSVERFKTGARHYVYDLEFERGSPVVLRIGESSARAEMAGAVHLSRLLRPLSVPLPAILADDLEAPLPWLMLERL